MLGNVRITQMEEGREKTISDLRMCYGYNWCSELPLSTVSSYYGAVMSGNELLVNVDDYVAFESADREVLRH